MQHMILSITKMVILALICNEQYPATKLSMFL